MSMEPIVRESKLHLPIAEAADPGPKNLTDLLVDFDAEAIKGRLFWWLADAPVGKELL
jgi:hypothetical protein